MTSVFEENSYLWRQAARHHLWRGARDIWRECDLAVVGAGAAGMAAALAAAEKGERVVQFETQPQPGGLFAQNGGIVQDGFEGKLGYIEKRLGLPPEEARALLKQLLLISHNGLRTVRRLAQVAGTRFDEVGFLTTFRTEKQYEEHKSQLALQRTLLPKIYDPKKFVDVDARQIIGGRHYRYGGIWSRYGGGAINPAELALGLVDHMARPSLQVQLCTHTTVTEVEAATRHGVRLQYESRDGLGETVARRAVVTAGAGALIPGFQPSELSSTGMFAITNVPAEIVEMVTQSHYGGVPHVGPETIMPAYYRFINERHGLTLLFGGSGRVGLHEDRGIDGESLTMRDVRRAMFDILPPLKTAFEKHGLQPAAQWARYLSFSPHDMPVVFGYDPATSKFIRFKDLLGSMGYGPPHIPIIYIGELGGQGNVLALDLGTRAGRFSNADFQALMAFDRLNPQSPTRRQHLQRRAAKERRDLRRN